MAQGFVIGSGIAGLLAAHALASQGWEITIAEKDKLTSQPSLRKGTPQAAHAHMLLKHGLDTIEEIVPGFRTALIHGGGVSANMGRDWRTTLQAGTLARGTSQLDFISASRALIEYTLRSLAERHPGITIQDETRVDNVELSESNQPIIQWTQRRFEPKVTKTDLLVDASGRGSKILKWLQAGGFDPVSESTTQTMLGYASCRFQGIRLTPGDLGWSCMYQAPAFPYGGVIMPVENEEYVVTLSGLNDNDPPRDLDGLLDFATNLRCKGFHKALEAGITTSRIYTFRKPINYYRAFQRLKRWPKSFILIGDNVCSFNPVYGQGMSAAAIAAKSILNHATTLEPESTRQLQRAINRAYLIPWLIAKNEDQRWVTSPALHARITHYLMDKINVAGTHDSQIAEDFLSVLHMTRGPSHLLNLRTIIKAIRA